jgi:hypothetical protein
MHAILSSPVKFLSLAIVLCLSLSGYAQPTAAPTATPLQYVLLNDTSGRTLWPGGIEQQVSMASQFLRQVVTPGSDLGSVVNFSEEYWLEVENSTDPDDLVAKLIHQGRRGTKLYEAVVEAARWLSKQETSDKRKIIFVISDGDDDASQISLQDAITTVQSVHIPVVVIAPSVVERKKPGKDMKQLASATGGHAYFVRGNSLDFALLKRDLAR